MKKLVLLGILFIKSLPALAQNFQIIEVKRNIQMSETDPVVRDFYLNAGKSDGLNENSLLKAFRRTPVKDLTGTQNLGELLVPVGELKIIFASDKISIARETKSSSNSQYPLTEQPGFQVGDRLEPTSKKSKK